MHIENYEFEISDNFYTFISTGKREIPKLVYFQELAENCFNIVLIDYNIENDTFSDDSNSNNGDMSEVMKTVILIIIDFVINHREACVLLKGNSKNRNSLYNRLINNYYTLFEDKISVYIEQNNEKRLFTVGDKSELFYIYHK